MPGPADLYTLAVHAGEAPDPATGAVTPPIHASATFAFDDAAAMAAVAAGERAGYAYSRWTNPTVVALERKVAALEGGEAAVAVGSGMAAIAGALLAVAGSGDHLVAARAIYAGTYDLLTRTLPALGVAVAFVDAGDPDAIERAITPRTKALFVETPGNPMLNLVDLDVIARVGSAKRVTTIVDNTFATPVNQRPLAHGVDVVVHSATKYLSGHGDALGGVVVGPVELVERARERMRRELGAVLSPFDAWLILRGIHTLPLRVERQNATALTVARWLETRPEIASVHYPGLERHPAHALARRQMRGFGGVVAFELSGGMEAGRHLVERVRLCRLAVSLGETRSLVLHLASMTECALPPAERAKVGITDGLVRLSVGLEAPEAIIDDLAQALAE